MKSEPRRESLPHVNASGRLFSVYADLAGNDAHTEREDISSSLISISPRNIYHIDSSKLCNEMHSCATHCILSVEHMAPSHGIIWETPLQKEASAK
jgi:hypothetical protein